MRKKVKYETTMKIRPQKPLVSINQVLDNLLYSQHPIILMENRPAMNAYHFLEELKAKGRLSVSSWDEYTKSKHLTTQQYYSVIKKLQGAGMIYKKDGEWLISKQFGLRCRETANLWDSYIDY